MDDHEIEELLNSKSEQETDMETLKAHVVELRKRFDSVRIFCTRDKPNMAGTMSCDWGGGNWFAQYGQIVQWVEQESKEE